MPETLHLPYSQIVQTLTAILQKCGMRPDRAAKCAELFANSSRDGVPSHGLNRFAGFARRVRDGAIAGNAEMCLVQKFGALERWDGMLGTGPWNAWVSMTRAMEIAKEHGIGCVGLSRTNHWMRAGNYGWQAADAGCVGICWTNTWPLMAAWGAAGSGKRKKLGNNPLVMAVPRKNGEHVVLDMAMSQYSMGKLGIMRNAAEQAPLPAGFDRDGNITRDPAAVIDGGSAMPIGYWKGTGLAMMLDLIAGVLSGGLVSADLAKQTWEHQVSQVFIAIDARKAGVDVEAVAERVISDLRAGGEGALYPGERSLAARRDSMQKGVAVDVDVWGEILKS